MSARRIAIVTGGSRGIGRAIALELAESGHDVVVAYHSRTGDAAKAVTEIEGLGGRAAAVQCDVSDQAACADLVEVARQWGPVRAIVSNATGFSGGSVGLGLALSTSLTTYESLFRARIAPLLSLVEAAGADMDDGGRVVAMVSTGTEQVLRGYAAVATGMAATETLVKYLAVELGRRGITVNAVSGGLVATDALAEIHRDPARLVEAVGRSTPLGRVGRPEDIAAVVGLLCSPRAGWVTGRTIVADGGNVLL